MPTPATPHHGRLRDQSATARLLAADERDAIASIRDLAAITRDRASEARDLRRTLHLVDEGAPAAADDRQDAAADREQAAFERLHALVDRELLADALAVAANDPLTGARARAAGLHELDLLLDRSRRGAGLLVVAYVDVVGLKALNDSKGHAAGDALLRDVVTLIRGHLRSYDLTIRVGGDEFVCAMADMSLVDARLRFRRVCAELAGAPHGYAIRTGLAQLTAHENATELIARADVKLIDGPHAQH